MKIATILLSLLLLVAGVAAAEKNVDRTVPAGSAERVSIQNLAGSLEISGWNRDEVQVTGTLGDDVEGLDIREQGGVIEIEVKIPKGEGKKDRKLDAHLTIRVPASMRVSAETVSASITAGDLSGELALQSVSGAVRVTGQPTAVEAETVSGAIDLSGLNTRIDAQTVSGEVNLAGVAGQVSVQSVSSKIVVAADDIEQGELQTVSGAIELSGDLAANARLEVQSHSGSVTLSLPAGVSAHFEVQTFSGSVDNSFGPPAEKPGGHGPGKNLSFSTGGGSAEVSIQTFSGSVKLRQR